MKKPIEVKKKLKKVTEYTACFAFLMFLQGVGVMAVSAVSCGIIIILLYFILGWNLYISFLIGTAVAAAIIFSQVWKSRSGLSAIEFYRARKYRKSTAKLVWKSDEYNQARKNYLKKEK